MTPAELDALIEHLINAERRLTVAFAKVGVDSSVLNDMRLLSNAAIALRKQGDALVQLREENARLRDELALMGHPPAQIQKLERRAERAEAELARGKAGAEKELTDTTERLANAEAEVARLKADAIEWQDCALVMQTERDALAGTISQQIDALQRLVCERDMLNADAERYRFIRSPLAGDSGVVQKELWVEFCYKTCREDKMDALIDGAMRLLRYHIDAAKEKP